MDTLLKFYNLKLVGINHHTYKIIQNLSLSLLRAITIEIEIKERSKEIIPKMKQGRKRAITLQGPIEKSPIIVG